MSVTINGSTGVTSPAGTFTDGLTSTTGTFSVGVQVEGVTTNIYPLVSGTAVAVSGTAVDFTGIPSWATRITVVFSNVRKSAGASPLIQLITASGAVTTGYLCVGSSTSTGVGINSYTTGFGFRATGATDTLSGVFVIAEVNAATNIWSASGVLGNTATANTCATAGTVTLASALIGIRLTTTSTDTYNQGTVNILYE
jgi:hypothetical protein